MLHEFAARFWNLFVPATLPLRRRNSSNLANIAIVESLESRQLFSAVAIVHSAVIEHDVAAVDTAPVVKTDPKSQSIDAGKTVTFTAAASGDPTPTVQWQVSTGTGKPFTNITGATSTTLSFVVKTGETGYEYKAVFKNSVSTATTTAATLTVLTAPAITTSPKSQSIDVGKTVTFTAAASGNPKPTVQWEVSTGAGKSFTNITGATSTTLSFVVKTGETGYEYKAVFKNSVSTATTTAATLTVLTAPAITTSPKSQSIDAGKTVTFTAAASGNPKPTVQWEVSTGAGKPFTNITGATSTTLSFVVKAGEAGYEYKAVFKNSVSTATTTAATLTVLTAPAITTSPKSQSIDVGKTVTFTVAAKGNPTPTVQWQVSTGTGKPFTNIAGATSTTYHFTVTKAENGYRYQAVFKNSVGTVTTAAAVLTVPAPTFNGNYTGSFTGSITVDGMQFSIPSTLLPAGSNGIHATLTGSTVAVSLPGIGGSGTGTISSSGGFQATTSGGSIGTLDGIGVKFTGTLKFNADGSVSGSGTWSIVISTVVTGSGTWTVSRSAA